MQDFGWQYLQESVLWTFFHSRALWLKRQAHRQRRPCYLYAFSGAGDLHFGSTNMLKGGKVETLANPSDMFGLLNLPGLQVCKHMPRPLRKELELDLSQAGFRTLPNFAFPEWQFSKSLGILHSFHDFYFAWEESSGFLTEKLWGWNLFGRCISRSCHEASTRDMAKRSGSAAPNVVSGILDDLGNRRGITRWTYMKPGYMW